MEHTLSAPRYTEQCMRRIKVIRGHEIEFGGEVHSGWLPDGAAPPLPTPVHIVLADFAIVQEDDGGFILEWCRAAGEYGGDTWHESLEAAVSAAGAYFGIAPDEWQDGVE